MSQAIRAAVIAAVIVSGLLALGRAAAYSVLAHATAIPEMTQVARSKKRDQIRKVIPRAQKKTVVFSLQRFGLSPMPMPRLATTARSRSRHCPLYNSTP